MYRCMFVGCFARPGDVTQVWLHILSTSESRCGLKLCKSPKENPVRFKFLKKLCDRCNLCYVHWLNCSHWALLIFTNRKVIYFSKRSQDLIAHQVMALWKEYTNEQVNCFKVCYVTSESVELYFYIQLYLSASVRETFKEKWDNYCTKEQQIKNHTPFLYLHIYQGLRCWINVTLGTATKLSETEKWLFKTFKGPFIIYEKGGGEGGHVYFWAILKK